MEAIITSSKIGEQSFGYTISIFSPMNNTYLKYERNKQK